MQEGTGVLIVFAIMIGFFLLGREIVCWYWKINRSLELQDAILKEMRNMNAELQKRNLDRVG